MRIAGCASIRRVCSQTAGRLGARARAGPRRGWCDRDIHHLIGSGGSFGANPLSPQLGLGRATELEFVEITWPATQEVQRWRGFFNRAYRLREGETIASEVELPRMRFRRADHAEHAH